MYPSGGGHFQQQPPYPVVQQQPNSVAYPPPPPSAYPAAAHPPPYSAYHQYPLPPSAPYPAAGQYCPPGGCPQQQQQVIYRDGGRPQSSWTNDPWLMSLAALCCGCFLGEALCDQPCCCCLIPCSLPRFR